MVSGIFKKISPLLLAGIILVLVAGVILIFDRVDNPERIRLRVKGQIERDLSEQIQKSEALGLDYLSGSPGGDLPDVDGHVRLVLNEKCQLIHWNNSEHLPSERFRDICEYPSHRTLQNKNKLYYLFRQELRGVILITLIPLKIDYRIKNSVLPPYVYLGRYNADGNLAPHISEIRVDLKVVKGGVPIFDRDGNFIFSLSFPDPEIFVYSRRQLLAVLGFLGLLFLLTWGYRRLRTRLPDLAPPVLIGFLIIARFAMLQAGFPNSFVPSRLFSPSLLAVGGWAPSLGDLCLNVMVLLVVIFSLHQAYHHRVSQVFQRILQHGSLSYVVHFIFISVAIGLVWVFLGVVESVILHSTIYFDFSNVFKLDLYSFVVFLAIGGLLTSLQVFLLHLIRFSWQFINGGGREKWIRYGLSAIYIAGFSYLGMGFGLELLLLICLVMILTVLILIRTSGSLSLNLDLPNFLVLIVIFSLLFTGGILRGKAKRDRILMERVAERQSDDHDLITESIFERVVMEVEDESEIQMYQFMSDSSYSRISGFLKENYFEPNFKGYDVRVFVYRPDSVRLDNSPWEPYLPPSSRFTLDEVGRPTMTPKLYLLPTFLDIFEFKYIGQFEVPHPVLRKIIIQVELIHSEIQPDRLNPQLLLDDKVRSKEEGVTNRISYAVYREGKLLRKQSDNPFPLNYSGPDKQANRGYFFRETDGYKNLFFQPTSAKSIHVRIPSISLLDAANLFSYIFYFFVIIFIILMLPVWAVRILKGPKGSLNLSLKSRIQVFFLCISVLPLLVVIFLLSPYIKQHLFSDISRDLGQETSRIAGLMRDDYYSLRMNRPGMARVLKERLREMEKIIYNDINIYYPTGELNLTTQISIYELGLTSKYMNPYVFEQIRSGKASDMVVEERIGNVNYFSAYYPMMTNRRNLIGILNIPLFKNPDQVNEQSLSLLTFLVNIYVFIFLTIGLIAVLITNSIFRPLTLLSEKLAATTLGKTNEPIKWSSRDEIGEIITSYNEMLKKLAKSEKRLAQNERELAWKEMARQVAHEIKNPLTPMKLSVQHLVRSWNERKPNLEDMFRKVTHTILVQIDSLANIADSFSEFAKMPEPQKTIFSLREVVQEVGELYAHHLEVQIKLDLPEEEFYVNSDRDQLSRVFNNLIKNGLQAIEHDRGEISVKMEILGSMARVIIRDNGKGIPEEIRPKIFQPNFSTKTSGMGLGLAIVKRIVESNGGRIYFESEEGKGTTFFVEQPRAEKPS